MSTDTTGSETSTVASVPRSQVSLSAWVNEPLPSWHETLGAHEVARLTRRPRWMLAALAIVGRFPKPQRFRGHAIGWRRRDVEHWLLEAAGLSQDLRCLGKQGRSYEARHAGTSALHRKGGHCRRRTRAAPCRRRRYPQRTRAIDSSERTESLLGESLPLPLGHNGWIES